MDIKARSETPQGAVLLLRNENGKRFAVPLGEGNIVIIEEQTKKKGNKVKPYCSIHLRSPSFKNDCKFVDHTLDEIREAWQQATGETWVEVNQRPDDPADNGEIKA